MAQGKFAEAARLCRQLWVTPGVRAEPSTIGFTVLLYAQQLIRDGQLELAMEGLDLIPALDPGLRRRDTISYHQHRLLARISWKLRDRASTRKHLNSAAQAVANLIKSWEPSRALFTQGDRIYRELCTDVDPGGMETAWLIFLRFLSPDIHRSMIALAVDRLEGLIANEAKKPKQWD